MEPSSKRGRRAAGALFALAALAIVAGACSGHRDAPAASPEPSPVEAAIGFDPFSDWNADAFNEAMGECLAEAGFEYFPRERPEATASQFTSRDEAEEYGYGISLSFFGSDDQPTVTDPNTEYRAGLSSAAQAAYDLAYLGDGNRAGCIQQVQTELYGSSGEVAAPIGELIDTIRERLRADSRYLDAEADWSACMSRAGYDFRSRDDIQNVLQNSVNELLGAVPDPDNPNVVTYTDVNPSPEFTALQQRERQIAVADFDCSTDSKLDEVAAAVTVELENRFLDENPSWIERMRALQAGASSTEGTGG
jgi:hypothetical protein